LTTNCGNFDSGVKNFADPMKMGTPHFFIVTALPLHAMIPWGSVVLVWLSELSSILWNDLVGYS